MAIGKRKPIQQPLFVITESLNLGPHPFYAAVNKVLDAHHFDIFAEELCAKFYDDPAKGGRPGLAPGVYFRCLMIGYFEGIDSERGIAWRCADIDVGGFSPVKYSYQIKAPVYVDTWSDIVFGIQDGGNVGTIIILPEPIRSGEVFPSRFGRNRFRD